MFGYLDRWFPAAHLFFFALVQLAPKVSRFHFVELTPVIKKALFRVPDSFQVAVPVIPVCKGAEKLESLVPVVRADTLHLVQEESLIQRDDPRFQLGQYRFGGFADMILVYGVRTGRSANPFGRQRA